MDVQMSPSSRRIFLCERWRPADLDVSLAVYGRFRHEADTRGLVVDLWIGTEVDATAQGMTAGVLEASLFVLVLRDGTLMGRGVQHEVATALRANKPVLVLIDAADGMTLEQLLAQAASPNGAPVTGYDVLEAGDIVSLSAWAIHTAPPIPFRRDDGSFESATLPAIMKTAFSVLPHLPTAAMSTVPAAITAAPRIRATPFRLLTPRPPLGSCDALFVCGGPDALLTSLNLRRAAEAAVSRRALILHELPLTADAAQADAAVAGAGCVVAFLSAEFWRNCGAVTALEAARTTRRRIVAFCEDGMLEASVQGRPADLGAFAAETIVRVTERSEAGKKRSGQLEAFLKDAVGAVRSEAAPDALLPPPCPPNQLEAVLAVPRDSVIKALLAPPGAGTSTASITCDAASAGGAAVVVLSGAGGAGKSTAAAAVASDPRMDSVFDDIAWYTLGNASRVAVVRAIQTLLRALEAPALAPPGTLEKAIERLRGVCARRRVLLVIDDVWDADAALPFLGAVCGGGSSSSVLFTTRSRPALDAAVSRARMHSSCVNVDVAELPPPVALQLLRHSCGLPYEQLLSVTSTADIRIASEYTALTDAWETASPGIFSAMGTSPLALVLAGACVRTELAAVLTIDADTLSRSIKAVAALVRPKGSTCGVPAACEGSPATMTSDSWLDTPAFSDALLLRNPDAAAYKATYRAIQMWLAAALGRADLPKFALLGLLPDDAYAPEAVLAAGWRLSIDETRDLLKKFQSAGLVKWERQAQRALPHDLVHDFAAAMCATQSGGAALGHVALLASLAAMAGVRAPPLAPPTPATSVVQPLPLREWWAAEGTPFGHYIAARVVWHLLQARTAPGSTTLAEAGALLLRLPWLQYSLRKSGGYIALLDEVTAVVAALTCQPEALCARAATDLPPAAAALSTRPKLSVSPAATPPCASSVVLGHLFGAVRLSAGALQDADAYALLPAQLLCRMGALRDAHPSISSLLDNCREWRDSRPLLRPVSVALTGPDGPLIAVLDGHSVTVSCISALPDGSIVSGSLDTTLRVWQPATGVCERVLVGHCESVTCLAVLPDGRAVSGSDDATLRVWQTATGVCERVLDGHTANVICLSVLSDGRVVSGSDDGTLRVWQPALGISESLLEGHTDFVSCLAVLPDGRVVSGSGDQTLRLWQPATGICERVFEGHADIIKCLAVLRDGRVVSGSEDKVLRVWQPATGACEHLLSGHSFSVGCLTALPDGCIVSGSEDMTLRVWQPANALIKRELEGHTNRVNCLSVLPDGLVVSGSEDTTLRVWRPDSGASVHVLKGHTHAVTCLSVLPDGRVVSGSSDYTLRVWRPDSGECVRVLKGHASSVLCLSVLPDGRVVSGSSDYTLRVWRPDTGTCVRVLKGHTDAVLCLSILPNGCIVSGSNDKMLRVWQPDTDDCVCVLEGHSELVFCLSVLPDGRIVSRSEDLTLRVWRPAKGVCERVIESSEPDFNALDPLRFSHNDHQHIRGCNFKLNLQPVGTSLTATGDAVSRGGLAARAYVDAEIWSSVAVTIASGSLGIVLGCADGSVHTFHVVPEA
jgi:WD40 repeat protein